MAGTSSGGGANKFALTHGQTVSDSLQPIVGS
jgi:hypothetical protein